MDHCVRAGHATKHILARRGKVSVPAILLQLYYNNTFMCGLVTNTLARFAAQALRCREGGTNWWIVLTIDLMIAAFKAALRCAEFTRARPCPPSRARQEASACVNESDSPSVVAPRTRNAPEPSALWAPEKLKGMWDRPGR